MVGCTTVTENSGRGGVTTTKSKSSARPLEDLVRGNGSCVKTLEVRSSNNSLLLGNGNTAGESPARQFSVDVFMP